MIGLMLVRREHASDHQAVDRVHRAAFADSPGSDGGRVEAGLTERLRDGSWWLPRLSLVAELDGAVIGHVIATRAHVGTDGSPALGLGPLGVLPEHQKRGVGGALMHAVIAAAEALDETLIALLGHPGYYPRFGFVPAAELDVISPDPAWGAAFQARRLTAGAPRGMFRYAEPFERLG
jgi:putative acetyltransferase